jgi:hypothetical protein
LLWGKIPEQVCKAHGNSTFTKPVLMVVKPGWANSNHLFILNVYFFLFLRFQLLRVREISWLPFLQHVTFCPCTEISKPKKEAVTPWVWVVWQTFPQRGAYLCLSQHKLPPFTVSVPCDLHLSSPSPRSLELKHKWEPQKQSLGTTHCKLASEGSLSF